MLRVFLSVSAFLLTLIACLLATVTIARGPIERDLTERSLEALEGLDGFRLDLCEIGFEGRDGWVRGEVKSPEIKAAAESRLRDLYGARVIETELVVRPYDAPWIMVERQAGGGVNVAGLLADDGERRALSGGLSKALSDGSAVDLKVEVRDKVEPARWLPRLISVAGDLLPLAEGSKVNLSGAVLTVSGEMPDVAAEQEFVGRAQQLFDGAGIELEFALTVAPPPEPAQFRMFPPENGEITVAGRLADLGSAEELLSVLRENGNWLVKDQIVVAENTGAAPWVEGLTFLLPSMLSEVVGGGVKIEGGQLELDGQLDSEGMFEAISELVVQNFPPPDYEVQNHIQVVEPPREAMVSVITYPGGRIQLKGLLPEASQKARIIAAVGGAAVGELLTEELLVETNVMAAAWIDNLVGLLPNYVRQVKRGGLTINSQTLTVEAEIDSDSDRDSIWAMTEHFFPDDQYRRNLELRFSSEIPADEDSLENK